MADISDVEDAFAALVQTIVYPTGATGPSIVGSVCRIYRGWPNAATLNADLGDRIVNLTVVTDNDTGQTTTRYLQKIYPQPVAAGTILTAIPGGVTISGSPTVGDVVGIIIDGTPFSYRVQETDTSGLVAGNLCLAIQHVRPAFANGAAVFIPGAHRVVPRCVVDSPARWETRRQEKDIRIIAWCPGPEIRDSLCATLDASFSIMNFIPLPDTTFARLQYKTTMSHDQAQNALLYRRDLVFKVEYPTIGFARLPSMLFGDSNLNGNPTIG